MQETTQKTYNRIQSRAQELAKNYADEQLELEQFEDHERDQIRATLRYKSVIFDSYFSFITESNSLGTFTTRLNAIRKITSDNKKEIDLYWRFENRIKEFLKTKKFAQVNSKRKTLKKIPADFREQSKRPTIPSVTRH